MRTKKYYSPEILAHLAFLSALHGYRVKGRDGPYVFLRHVTTRKQLNGTAGEIIALLQRQDTNDASTN